MDWGAWRAVVCGVAKSWTWLSTHPHIDASVFVTSSHACLVAKSCWTLGDPIRLQHCRLPCPSLSHGVCSISSSHAAKIILWIPAFCCCSSKLLQLRNVPFSDTLASSCFAVFEACWYCCCPMLILARHSRAGLNNRGDCYDFCVILTGMPNSELLFWSLLFSCVFIVQFFALAFGIISLLFLLIFCVLRFSNSLHTDGKGRQGFPSRCRGDDRLRLGSLGHSDLVVIHWLLPMLILFACFTLTFTFLCAYLFLVVLGL